MKIDIITIFPDIFYGPFSESIIARAIKRGLVEINVINLRDFTEDRHKTVDDTPYGGGPGMLMKPEPLFKAVESIKTSESCVILTTPLGKSFKQEHAHELSLKKHLIIICGHYEGIDERVRANLVDMEISIGDFILTSGNIPAMAIADATIRLMPGVLGKFDSTKEESFCYGLLEYPQYTKPVDFNGMKVPEILLSGNHKKIKEWRHDQALAITKERRPDLLK